MKNFRTLFAMFALVAAPFVMVSCSDDSNDTPEPIVPDIVSFGIEVKNIDATSATMTVTPSDDEILYIFDIVDKSVYEERYDSDISALIEAVIYGLSTSQNMTREEIVASVTSQGVDSYEYTSLEPETLYMAYAVQVSEQGEVLSELYSFDFTTPVLPQAEITWDVTFDQVEYDGVTFTITPSDDTIPYYFTVRPSYSYSEQMSEAEILDAVMSEDAMMLDYYAVTGEYISEYASQEFILCSDTGYDLIIFAYAEGQALSEAYLVPFRSKASEMEVSSPGFSLGVSNGDEKLFVSLQPEDVNRMYMWDVELQSKFEEYATPKDYINAYVDNLVETMGKYELDFARVMGEDSAEISQSNFAPNTPCVVWAAYIDERGEIDPDIIMVYEFEALGTESEATAVVNTMGVKPMLQNPDMRGRMIK